MKDRCSNLDMARILFGADPAAIELKIGHFKVPISEEAIRKIESLDPEKKIKVMRMMSQAAEDAKRIDIIPKH